ncbi:MAG: porin family protein [Bacteroidota bacterium]|nr:porin family protein [Bacteroidota bacterium]
MKTNLKTLLILLFMFLTFAGFSQKEQRMVRLGLKASPGIDWMNPDEKHYSYNGVAAGVTLGFVSDFYFNANYGLSTGFNFSFLGGKIQYPYAQKPDTGMISRKYSFRYLEIPLMIKMRTRQFGIVNYYAQVGFGTGFRLKASGKDDFDTKSDGIISDRGTLPVSETTAIREAVLVGAGAEINLDETISIVIGLSYSNSLNNVLKGSNTRYPNLDNRSTLNYAELTIGVLF